MTKLADKKCTACQGGIPPLEGMELKTYSSQLEAGWHVVHEHHLEKEFHFNDFKEALAFTNKVGELAEQEEHHPDIQLSWGKVRIVLWTHKINGLSESDFILAAKIDQILKNNLKNS
jgi:4a-hydroxytetrahydrobiopterin dehydratase